MSFIPSELIKQKKLGREHTDAEISWILRSYVDGTFADYQMSAWAMAVWFRGMSENETASFTRAMLESGRRFDFSNIKGPRIDKHSTGGVGDKTSLIIGPIMAAAKVHVPMIAGRGLGHTGGTLDKLESLKGFRVRLAADEFHQLVSNKYFALMGQTEDICPADRMLYSLRDVTSTVDSLPLICGSIMSKKLAEDLTGLVLDVKYGSGAFMKSIDEAIVLANLLKATGEKNGLRVSAVLSSMDQPLGRFLGNALEVHECYEILSNKKFIERGVDFYEPTRQLSLILTGHMLFLADKVNSPEAGVVLAEELLVSGAARMAFEDFLKNQGPSNIDSLRWSKKIYDLKSKSRGYVKSINTELVGLATIELLAGRKTSTDKINHSTGIEVCCNHGMFVEEGQTLLKIYYSQESHLQNSLELLNAAYEISDSKPNEILPLVAKVIT